MPLILWRCQRTGPGWPWICGEYYRWDGLNVHHQSKTARPKQRRCFVSGAGGLL